MSTRGRKLSKAEIRQAFSESTGAPLPPILTTEQLADLLQVSKKTLYEWVSKGRLDGAFRKRGKHHKFWRDRVLDIFFNGSDWKP